MPESGLPGGGGATSLTELTDFPSSYTGQAGKILTVDPSETEVVFTSQSAASLPYDVYTAKIFAFSARKDSGTLTIGEEYVVTSVANGGTGLKTQTTTTNPGFIGDPFVIGDTYTITIDPSLFGDDFSNIGYVAVNVPFVATGTTPNQWLSVPVSFILRQQIVTDDFSNVGFLSEDTPFIATSTTPNTWVNGTVVTNLTLSTIDVVILQDDVGSITIDDLSFSKNYFEIKSSGLFIKNKTFLNVAQIGEYNSSGQNVEWKDVNTIRAFMWVTSGNLPPFSDLDLDIEIRIYP